MMAFGQPYPPMGYNPYYSTPGQAMPDQLAQLRGQYQPQTAPQPPQNNGIVWVQGEAGAKSFLVAAGNSVLLMDSEGQTFYLKTADASGMPSMRVFDYTERTQPQRMSGANPTPQAEFVTRAEFEAFASRFEQQPTSRKKVKEVNENAEPAV